MQIWILIAVFAHFLNAVTAIVDKHIVSDKVMKPVVYAFYSGIFQIEYLLAIPVLAVLWPEIAFRFPSWELFALAAFAGALFIFTLTIFYQAIRLAEVSRVTPMVGVSVPVFTFLLSFIFLGESLSARQGVAFTLFLIGGFFMSANISQGRITKVRGTALALVSGFLFASYYVIIDFLFGRVGFLDAFILIQFGGFLGAVLLLVPSKSRREILGMKEEENDIIENRTSAVLFVSDKLTSAVAAFLLTYSISIGDVVIVNSLQATQYAFTLILAIILSKKLPSFCREQTGKDVILQKSFSLVLIAIGLILIA